MAHIELNLREWRKIEDMLHAKISVREIASAINRHVSTVYREIKCNHYYDVANHTRLSSLPSPANWPHRRVCA